MCEDACTHNGNHLPAAWTYRILRVKESVRVHAHECICDGVHSYIHNLAHTYSVTYLVYIVVQANLQAKMQMCKRE